MGMSRRAVKWAGVGVTTATIVVLVTYFAYVGLDKADKLASVFGLVVALIGLSMTIFGVAGERQDSNSSSQEAAPSSTNNRIDGTVSNSQVIQAGNISDSSVGIPPQPSEVPGTDTATGPEQ